MTGFGKAEATAGNKKFSVEIIVFYYKNPDLPWVFHLGYFLFRIFEIPVFGKFLF